MLAVKHAPQGQQEARAERHHPDDVPLASRRLSQQARAERGHEGEERHLPEGVEEEGQNPPAKCFHGGPPSPPAATAR